MIAAVLKSGEPLDTSVRYGFFAIQPENKDRHRCAERSAR
jgi:hypothetical protein